MLLKVCFDMFLELTWLGLVGETAKESCSGEVTAKKEGPVRRLQKAKDQARNTCAFLFFRVLTRSLPQSEPRSCRQWHHGRARGLQTGITLRICVSVYTKTSARQPKKQLAERLWTAEKNTGI